MNEAEEPTPETSTPDAGSTRDATLGRFMLWTAVGIGAIAAFNAIGKAALSKQREAQLERVVRAGVEARRWGLPPRPVVQGRGCMGRDAGPCTRPEQGWSGTGGWTMLSETAGDETAG